MSTSQSLNSETNEIETSVLENVRFFSSVVWIMRREKMSGFRTKRKGERMLD